MSDKFRNLNDIEVRKRELRKQIAKQEAKLGKDFEAYSEDVDTLKRVWSSVVGIRNFGKRAAESGIGQVTRIAGEATGLLGKSKWSTAIVLASNIASWLWNRKRKKKK